MDVERVSFSAPGKVILFGEHSVVYGYPAIATAIGLRAKCSVISTSTKQNSISIPNLISDRKFIIGEVNPICLKPFEFIINQILKESKERKNLEIEIMSELPISAGLGSSAAVSVSLAASLFSILRVDSSKERISNVAFEAEKLIHGTPSGIDNTISTFGGSIIFEKGHVKQIPIKIPSAIFLIVNSLVPRNTKDLVHKLGINYKKNPNIYSQIFDEIGEVVNESQKFLENGDLEGIGVLMNRNHRLLEKLGVGHKQLTKIVKIMNDQNAIGCKLTGAGGGGCVIGLFENGEKINKTIEILRNEGYHTFITDISSEGVRND